MTNDIDSVDWTELETAYGNASEVPDLLRAAADSKAAAARKALKTLDNLINHQGYPSSAAASVVPFLVELIAEEKTGALDAALSLYGALAIGGMPAHFVASRETFEQGVAAGIVPEEGVAAREAAVPLAVRLEGLCRHKKVALRSRAIWACALASRSQEFLDSLAEQAQREANEGALATLLWAQGFICKESSRELPGDFTAWLTHQSPLVRGAAALALSLSGADLSQEQLQPLLDWYLGELSAPPSFPVADEGLKALAEGAIFQLLLQNRDLELALSIIRAVRSSQEINNVLFPIFFEKRERAVLPSELSETERRIVQTCLEVGSDGSNFALPAFGIASTHVKSLQVYLAASDHPVTRQVAGVPLWYAYTEAINGWSTGKAWQQYLAGASLAELLETLRLLVGPDRVYNYFPWDCLDHPGRIKGLALARSDTRQVEFWCEALLSRGTPEELRLAALNTPVGAIGAAALLLALSRSAPEKLPGLEAAWEKAFVLSAVNLYEVLERFPREFLEEQVGKGHGNVFPELFLTVLRPSKEDVGYALKHLAQSKDPVPPEWVDRLLPPLREFGADIARGLLDEGKVRSEEVAAQMRQYFLE